VDPEPGSQAFFAIRFSRKDIFLSKVICVSNSFFLYNFTRGLMKAMSLRGIDVIAAAPTDEFSEKLKTEGFPCRPLVHFDRKGANPVRDARFTRELYRLYKEERPDLVLHFTIKPNVYGTFAARLAGVKSICTVTGLGWLFTEKSLKTVLGGAGYKILYKIAFSSCETVFFLNADDKTFFLRNRLIKTKKCSVIPGSGVNTDHFCLSSIQSPQGDPSRIVFLVVGRMLWNKGIAEFVEAARIVKAIHPHAQFTLLGPIDTENRSGITLDVIRSWESQGLVNYAGSTDDIRPHVARSDVVVLPSYREGVPNSLLEAMAMERPIITTNTVGCKETVEQGKNGYMVPIKDPEALAEACIRVIELSPEERRRMGRCGRQKALDEFDEKIVINAYLQATEAALARNR
jgi:glycosyltransferase involved in cell wall biosynthesis